MPRRIPPFPLAPVAYRRSPEFPRPDIQAIVRAALAGHPIELQRDQDFISLFHAMDREGVLDGHRLIREKVGPSRWLARVVPLPEYRALEALARQSPN